MTNTNKLIESSIGATQNCLDNLIPNYFFIGFCLGEEYKDIEKLKNGLKNKEIVEGIIEIYNKGKENVEKIMLGNTCSKCGKENIREDDVKFCKYCGAGL